MTDQPADHVAPWVPAWVQDAVFYQIFPDRFARSGRVPAPGPLEAWDAEPTLFGIKGGDLLGIVDHLDHIQSLGATALYLNPIFQSASNHRYHTYDYFAVDPLLGGNDALRALLDACHDRGMRVVLDGVFNHASRGFWPFNHVLETGIASPYVDWFFFDRRALAEGTPVRAYPPMLELEEGDGSPAEHSLARLGYEAWWGLPALPKINTGDPHAREYLMSVAEHWIRFGADGWRLDVAEEVPDEFWREFRQRVKAVHPETYIVAEIWYEKPEALQGDQYDALMNYPLGAAITSFVGASHLDRRVVDQQFTIAATVRDEDAPTFAARLERALTSAPADVMAVQLNLLDSHDTPRFLSMVGGDRAALKLATLIQMTLPGAPSIYYGDEIGMTGELDPLNRGAFPWDHPDTWDRDLLASMTGATALRHAEPALRRGWYGMLAAEGSAVCYQRGLDDDRVLVAVNAGDAPATLDVGGLDDQEGRTFAIRRWTGGPDGLTGEARTVEGGRLRLELAPRDAAVLVGA